MSPSMSRGRRSGAALPASTCRACSATWRSAQPWRWPPDAPSSAPRSRRSIPARSRISRRAPPLSTRPPVGGFVSGSASRTRRAIAAWESCPVGRCMVALAGEIADGLIFANGSRSHMRESLSALLAAKRGHPDFLVANMIPTCIADDIEAAKTVNRRTLTRYTLLPNYRNYWKEAGYIDEMTAIETAIAENREADIPSLMSDRWLADATLFGPAARVREGVAAWRDAGVTTPILVPSSAYGNQLKAVEEIFAAFA
ncbi:MAG: LLM class flavin-dependent oxidoreductase [Alphaproteobacteria bacterium]|nr:MAG: LLM class flavin-dependent oxidoreductase [Alphaproteobacteria bacterium]